MSRNDLEPGTAIESQAKGHPATGTEEAGRASQGATPATRNERGLTNPTGCPPLSHFRLYEPSECTGRDDYPEAWHQTIKHEVRELAGHRCVRCLHPYRKGDGEWSRCDDRCCHLGPARVLSGEDWYELDATTRLLPEALREGLVEARYRILTVHHLDGNKGNCRWWNLVALCQRCHLQIQGKVKMERRWLHEHSDWFKPYVAGYYANVYLGQAISREEVEARLDELLALEHHQMEFS